MSPSDYPKNRQSASGITPQAGPTAARQTPDYSAAGRPGPSIGTNQQKGRSMRES